MKFRITFKTPDALDAQTLCEDIALECDRPDVGPEQECPHCEEELKKCKTLFNKFVRYDELITVEFDTQAGTATIIGV